MIMSKYNQFYKVGLAKEDAFAKLLVDTYGGKTRHSSKEDDMYNHLDIIWSFNNKDYSFDVKGLKKHNQKDINTDDSIHWIEIQNVRGNKGWIFGKADYIAFETNENWLIVRRNDIIDWIDKKVIDKTIVYSKDLYTYYQRYGRDDIVVKVLTEDLRKIAHATINK